MKKTRHEGRRYFAHRTEKFSIGENVCFSSRIKFLGRENRCNEGNSSHLRCRQVGFARSMDNSDQLGSEKRTFGSFLFFDFAVLIAKVQTKRQGSNLDIALAKPVFDLLHERSRAVGGIAISNNVPNIDRREDKNMRQLWCHTNRQENLRRAQSFRSRENENIQRETNEQEKFLLSVPNERETNWNGIRLRKETSRMTERCEVNRSMRESCRFDEDCPSALGLRVRSRFY